MPRGRKSPRSRSDADRSQLQAIGNSTTVPHTSALRARVILTRAKGLAMSAVARQIGALPPTVGKWRECSLAGGIQGLHDELRPGRPRTFDAERVAQSSNCLRSL